MDKAIIKFINYLQTESDKLQKEIYTEAYQYQTAYTPFIDRALLEKSENDNIIRLLSLPKDKWPLYNEIFNEFKVLSQRLESAPLSLSEKVTVLFIFFERNIASHVLEADTKAFEQKAIKNYHFKTMTSEEVIELTRSEKYSYLISTPDEELSEEDLIIKKDINDFTDKNLIDVSDIIKNNRSINDHYLKIKDSYTETDIKIIIDTLKNMGVIESILEATKIVLAKKIQKRQNSQKIITFNNFNSSKDEQSSKKYLSDKEYKNIKKELSTYYDLYKSKLRRSLSYEEMIYCVNLLVQLGESKDAINLFIMNAEKVCISDNPITRYLQYYDKLKYYSKVIISDENMAEMDEYFKEIFICDDEDYLFWKNNLASILSSEINHLPLSAEYEIELSKKLKS